MVKVLPELVVQLKNVETGKVTDLVNICQFTPFVAPVIPKGSVQILRNGEWGRGVYTFVTECYIGERGICNSVT